MSDTPLPLAGRRVLVTRAAAQSRDLKAALEARGAQVFEVPCIATVPEPPQALRDALDAGPDWLVVTSPNGARALAALGARDWPAVAAVGPGTAGTLQAMKVPVARVAEQADGLGLAAALAGEVMGKRVLLARGDLAGDDLPDALRAAGALVAGVVVYRTIAAPELAGKLAYARAQGEPDWVTLASGSAFQHLLAAWPEVLGARLAVIGPRTREAVEAAGGRVAAEAAAPTTEALVAALEASARTASR